MDGPNFAAIVPVYNRAKVTLEALDSIAAQRVPPRVLVVVDDGSTDGSADSVEQWIARRQPAFDVKMIRQANAGAPAAINAGIEAVGDCELIGVLDSDDLWPADYVQYMTRDLNEQPDAVAATCDKVSIEYPSEKSHRISFKAIPSRATSWLVRHGSTGPSNTIYRASAFRAAGRFNPQIRTGYDLNFMLRLSMRGRWIYVPGPVVTYRHNYAEMFGEVAALSHSFSDRRLRRAQNLLRFISEEGGREVVDESVWKPKLGSLWFKAGKQLVKLNRRDEARECFRKAVELRPWHLRSRLRAMWT